MDSLFVPIALVLIVLVNLFLMKIDLQFWKNFLTERGKRHKKVNTNR